MPLPTCNKCKHKWTWKEVISQTFTTRYYFNCPNCDRTLQTSKSFRRKSNLSFFLMLAIVFGGNFYFGPSVFALVALFIASTTYFALFPYFITFDKKSR